MKSDSLKKMPTDKIGIAECILRALGHPMRMKIIAFIDKHKEINVNKIYKALQIEQSVASQQLRILRDEDIVQTDKKGKFVYYSLNYEALKNVIHSVDRFLNAA